MKYTKLKVGFTIIVALVILFEEWGWEPLQRLLARLGRLPLLRQIEGLITRLPPKAALAVFLLPTLLLLPIKLLALWFIGNGHRLLGLLVIVAAKLVGTAVVARLFTLTRPALMTMPSLTIRVAPYGTLWRSRSRPMSSVISTSPEREMTIWSPLPFVT